MYEEKFQAAATLVKESRDREGLDALLPLIDENPEDFRLYAVIGEAFMNSRMFDPAEKALVMANDLHHDKFIQIRLADCYTCQRKFAKAKPMLDKLKAQFIGTIDAPLWACSQAEYLSATGKYDEAEKLYAWVIQEVPHWPTPWGGLGNLNALQHRYERAVHCWGIHHQLRPTWRTAIDLCYGYGIADKWTEAYELGRWSYITKEGDKRYLGHPEWDGKDCDEVLVCADGGLGDLLQYSRYINLIKGNVKLWVQKRHYEVARCLRFDKPVELIESYKDVDKSVPLAWLMFLPGVMGMPRPQEAPSPVRADFGTIKMPQPAIAISWYGDLKHANDHLRSTRLAQWARLILKFPQVHWFTVNPDKKAAKEIASTRLPVTQYCTSLRDACRYLATADAYVGVDTGHAHVAATAGKPSLCLLVNWVDNRWTAAGNRTNLYPDFLLYRGYEYPRLKDAIDEMAEDLENILVTRNNQGAQAIAG